MRIGTRKPEFGEGVLLSITGPKSTCQPCTNKKQAEFTLQGKVYIFEVA